MKLTECYIENFGTLSDVRISLADGLNCIKKDNGYGKTTLTVFIKAMLYGLDSTKKQTSDRRRYMPWQGGRCGGSLSFETERGSYRIERSFASKAADDTFRLYDLRLGKESTDYTERVGEDLFGIDEDGFLRTVLLSEDNLSGKNDNKTVSARLSDLVGYDGDVGGLDEAIELLEKQRKTYRKRGGAGEIENIRERAAAEERRINDILRKKQEYVALERERAAIKSELSVAYGERAKLRENINRENEARVRCAYIKQYKEMLAEAEKEKARLSEAARFFANRSTTEAEIESMRDREREARSLNEVLPTGSRLDELKNLFKKAGATEEEFINAESLLHRYEQAKIMQRIKESELDEKKEMRILPTTEEIDRRIEGLSLSKISKKANNSWHFSLPIGLIATAAGVMLGMHYAPLFIICAFSAVLTVHGIIGALKSTRKCDTDTDHIGDAIAFLSKYGISASDKSDIPMKLYELRAMTAAETARKRDREDGRLQIAAIRQELSDCELKLQSFLTRFTADTSDFTAKIKNLLKDHELYLNLLRADEVAEAERAAKVRRASQYREEVSEFISSFPTKSERPLDEIYEMLKGYTAAIAAAKRTRENAARYAEEHSIVESDLTLPSIDAKISETADGNAEEKILSLENKKALVERQMDELYKDIELYDEAVMARDELSELLSEYESRYNTILLTKEFLTEAKDILTTKYLSRTKEAFDRFISEIGAEAPEEFSMSTSFEIMKNERGSMKDADAYSLGTRELYALAARLALIESLYEDEQPFVILDDPFAHFDDKRLERALGALCRLAKNKQIIYLTCSSAREA